MKPAPLAAIVTAAALYSWQGAGAAPPPDPNPRNPDARDLHVLLQGDSAEELAQLVEREGGHITHDLHIIDAVGARMDRAQLDRMLETGKVRRHMDDLGDPDPPEEEEENCKVRGHIELTMAPGEITWPLYNKRDEAAHWRQLSITWPARLGSIEEISLGDHDLDPRLYREQDGHSVTLDFDRQDVPPVNERIDLRVRFSDAGPPGDPPLRQGDFGMAASFYGDCETDLVPGYVNNHGDFYYNRVFGIEPLHLQGIRGQGVTVAVVDSGLWEHPALMKDTRGKNRVLARYDAITDTLDREVLDESGHGTHMTSIIAHSGPTLRDGRETGTFKGVAPDASLVAVKILDRQGRAHLLDIVRAIQWVVDNREKYGIRVLNLSFAQLPRWYYWDDPVNQAVLRAWADGIVVVAAAGNEGPEPMTVGSPGNLPYVITVGAVTDSWTPETRDDDYIPDFSSRGPTPAGHVKPDIVALGGHMTGLIHPDSDLATAQPEDVLHTGEYASTGSSQSAALVSGLVALLLQLEPRLTPDDIKCKLITSAEPAINRDGLLAYSPFQQGYGYVTAARAITLGETGCGNADLDIAADIAGEEHFFGPAEFDEEGNAALPGFDETVSAEPSASGLSDTRKWGVKEHIERGDQAPAKPPPEGKLPFNWWPLYEAERKKIERLANGESEPATTAQ